MADAILEKVKKCYRYRDYDTAVFLTSYLLAGDPGYALLMGILLYENGEMSRCIFHLKGLGTTTALFYRALASRKLKKFSEATSCLRCVLEGNSTADQSPDGWYSSFFVHRTDTEFFNMMIGELYIQRGRSRHGLDRYRKVMFKNPLLKAADGLFSENNRIEQIEQLKTDLVMNYYTDLFSAKKGLEDSSCASLYQRSQAGHPKDRKLACAAGGGTAHGRGNYVDYASVPVFGSYFVSKLAAITAQVGSESESLRLFGGLRDKDPFYIREMDSYSTLLWKVKSENLLGLLAKELISSHPQHHITWTVIGNYYSLKGKNKESCLCLLRSLNIAENAQAYSLLGFESNAKNQYIEAQGFFKSSLAMLERNDKALFGLGISYAETCKPEQAAAFFSKALEINPFSLDMITYLIRFYVKTKEYEKALQKIQNVLFPRHSVDGNDFAQVVDFVEENSGTFKEMEELILCEFAEILLRYRHKSLAEKVLESVECRTSSYFSKKTMIENEEP